MKGLLTTQYKEIEVLHASAPAVQQSLKLIEK